jgi:hypothetical protein
MLGVIFMSKEKDSYIPIPEDVPASDLSDIYSSELEISDSKNSGKATNSDKGNSKSQNNANISRTNLDTALIDLNADGDNDESKYSDLI